jgi:hypothetical protein
MHQALASLFATIALLPLALLLARRGKRGAAVAIVAAGALATLVLATSLVPIERSEPTNRPIERPQDGYVGSGACRSCHPGEHASWAHSHHRSMTQPATRETVLAKFDALDLDCFGEPVSLRWRGDELWVALNKGARGERIERPIVQVTGSHHAQALWYSTGNERELGIVPMVYRVEEQRWLPFTAVFLMPPEWRTPPADGTWNQNCNGCHATHSMPRVDTGRVDTMAAELGIACEACHGPGQAHCEANRDPLRRHSLRTDQEAFDETVEHPLRMDAARDAETCGQCHSVSIVKREHFDSWREQGSPFRPGQELQKSQLVVSLADRNAPELRTKLQQDPQFFAHTFWNDDLPRVTGREFHGLVSSPCHNDGVGQRAMSCTSCHSLHQPESDAREPATWAKSQLKPGMDGNAACTQCHPEFVDANALTKHTRHAANSSGSNCMDCHMPHTSYGLLKAMRSHRVESPSVASELRTGRPNACNLCHLDKTLQWTQERLLEWHGAKPVELDEDQRTVAAGPRWMLTGDAGIRALAAWNAGREAARIASGSDWMLPYLARLLDDPYYAVRIVAVRSLRSLPSAPDLAGYDELMQQEGAAAIARRAHDAWQAPQRAQPEILLDGRGMQWDTFRRLYARRDDRVVFLAE